MSRGLKTGFLPLKLGLAVAPGEESGARTLPPRTPGVELAGE